MVLLSAVAVAVVFSSRVFALADLRDGSAEQASESADAVARAPRDSAQRVQAPRGEQLHLEGDAQQVIRSAFSLFHLGVEFVAPPPSMHIRFDMDDVSPAMVATVLGWQTHLRFVRIHPGSVTAVADTAQALAPYNRTRVYSMNDADEDTRNTMAQMITRLLPDSVVRVLGNTLMVTGPDDDLRHADTLFQLAHTPQPDIRLRIRVYRILHDRTSSAGVEPPSSTQSFSLLSEANQLISQNSSVAAELASASGLASSDTLEIALLLLAAGYTTSDLENGFVYFGGGLTYMGMSFASPSVNMSLSDTGLQLITESTLVTRDRQVANLHIGENYPIKVADVYSYTCTTSTTTSCSSASNWTESVMPSVQYENLGIQLRIEPQRIGTHDIFLNLDWKDQELAGTSVNNVPVLDRQELSNSVTLPFGSSALIAGYEGNTLTAGTAGLASNKSTDGERQQVLIVVTPELVTTDASAVGTGIPTPPDKNGHSKE